MRLPLGQPERHLQCDGQERLIGVCSHKMNFKSLEKIKSAHDHMYEKICVLPECSGVVFESYHWSQNLRCFAKVFQCLPKGSSV